MLLQLLMPPHSSGREDRAGCKVVWAISALTHPQYRVVCPGKGFVGPNGSRAVVDQHQLRHPPESGIPLGSQQSGQLTEFVEFLS